MSSRSPARPQTILILGSDHRAHTPQSAANSDTIMLVRLDPNSQTINVMSIPRDLQVNIPTPGGGAQTEKINASYPMGGPNLVVKTIQRNVFPRLKVNHIVDINFAGFKDLVDAIGCVYTDVDRRYFNENIGTAATNFSSINIQAGYQKLCDENALAYVRYRHTDTDIVRSARQQEFIRDAKDQYGQSRLINNRDKLLKIFGQHAQTDGDLHSVDGLINLFDLVAFADGHAIRRGPLPGDPQRVCAPGTVLRDRRCGRRGACLRIVHGGDQGQAPERLRKRRRQGRRPQASWVQRSDGRALRRCRGRPRPSPRDPRASLPVYYPKLIVAGTSYEGPTAGEYPRSYRIRDQKNHPHGAYRMVMAFNADLGQFYGVQGTSVAQRADPVRATGDPVRRWTPARASLRRPQAPDGCVAHVAGRVLGVEHTQSRPAPTGRCWGSRRRSVGADGPLSRLGSRSRRPRYPRPFAWPPNVNR